ncbi:MAG: ABC transporter ATP-binding protein [Candidatus Zipacnadales bacterium]
MIALRIEVKGLSKTYPGGVEALKPTDLTITDGVFALLGPNGSGKTTFMRMLATLLEPTQGTATIDGLDICKHARAIRRRLGYLPQDFGLYPSLTVEEQLDYMALLSELRDRQQRREAIERVMEQANLSSFRKRKVGELSGGMRQRLGIAQALLTQPQLLIIDEPTAGLDPEERIRIRSLLAELGGDRVIILSTHIVADVEATADSLVILHLGRVLFSGTIEELLERTRGRVWVCEVSRGELAQMKEDYVFTGVYRAGEAMRIRIVGEEVAGYVVQEAEPTLEDAYLDVMASAERKDNGT